MSAPVLNTPTLAAEQHDLGVVVERELVEEGAELLAHGRVVGVLALGVGEGDPSDAPLVVSLEEHAAVCHEAQRTR